MISVIIINEHCHALTVKAVRSVFDDMPQAQVIVIDNSESADEFSSLKNSLPEKVVCEASPLDLGSDWACNFGLKYAHHDSIFFLNPHVQVTKGCLSALSTMLANLPSAGAVAPACFWDEGQEWYLPHADRQLKESKRDFFIQKEIEPIFFWWNLLNKVKTRKVFQSFKALTPIAQGQLSKNHLMISRKAVDLAGGFLGQDEISPFEREGLFTRLQKCGKKLYLIPGARVMHEISISPEHISKSSSSIHISETKRSQKSGSFFSEALKRWLRGDESSDFMDMGRVTGPPTWELNGRPEDVWLMEMGLHSSSIPIALHQFMGARITLPLSIWNLLGSGCYWVRFTLLKKNKISGERYSYRWSVEKPAVGLIDKDFSHEKFSKWVASAAALDLGDEMVLEGLNPPLAGRLGLAKKDESVSRWYKRREPAWKLDWTHLKDQEAWLKLFNQAFGHSMSSEFWKWKYQEAEPIGVCARGVQGDMVAFYGGMPREVLLRGRLIKAVQIGDVMVHPTHRGILTRQGPFQMVAATFLEQFIGFEKKYLLGFGFPSGKAMALAERLGLYAPVDKMVEMEWKIIKSKKTENFEYLPINKNHAEMVDAIWYQMKGALSNAVVGVRDWRRLLSRYIEHPDKPYKIYLIKQSKKYNPEKMGILILRDWNETGLECVDFIAHPSYFPVLIKAACQQALILNRSRIFAWITQSHANKLNYQNPEIHELDVLIPTNIWSPGPPVAEIKDRWFLMGGDTDFR